MLYKRFGSTIAVRLNRGEELMAKLKEVCKAEQISAGTISGIGASDYAVVALYEVNNRQYHSHSIEGEREMTSILGNVSQKDGEVYLHVHAAFVDKTGKCTGGHLNEAWISGTCEVFIQCLDGKIGRTVDAGTGLNVFSFED